MSLFTRSVSEGNLTGDQALMYAYGVYLGNGGTPDAFLDLTPDDVQMMLSAHLGDQERMLTRFVKSIGAMFGAKEED